VSGFIEPAFVIVYEVKFHSKRHRASTPSVPTQLEQARVGKG
jgi:hypothetical protein